VKRGGKTYLEIPILRKMREGVGQLLAELMRIKAEGITSHQGFDRQLPRYIHPGAGIGAGAGSKKLNIPRGRRQS